ncbi:hypothetical protein DMUE_3061 [Dictyocoela muelleri]|nr:hypothetical protein DMUE_3061 [Dictyocoela muelleri]
MQSENKLKTPTIDDLQDQLKEILAEEDIIKQRELSKSTIDFLSSILTSVDENYHNEDLFSILSLSDEYPQFIDNSIDLFQDDNEMKNKILRILDKSSLSRIQNEKFQMKIKNPKNYFRGEELQRNSVTQKIKIINETSDFIQTTISKPSEISTNLSSNNEDNTNKINTTEDNTNIININTNDINSNNDINTNGNIENSNQQIKRVKKSTFRVTWAKQLTKVCYIDVDEDYRNNIRHGGYKDFDINEADVLKLNEDVQWKIPEKLNLNPDCHNLESEEIKIQMKRELQTIPVNNLNEYGIAFTPSEHPDLQFDDFETKILPFTDLSHTNKFPDLDFNEIVYMSEDKKFDIQKILDDPNVIDAFLEKNDDEKDL